MSDRGFFNRAEGVRLIPESERDQEWSPFTKHVEKIARLFNEGFARHNIPDVLSFEYPDWLHNPASLGTEAKRYEFLDMLKAGLHPDGTLHENQIETVCDILKRIIDNPTTCVAVLGMMQCGKTGTSLGCHFIAAIIFLLTGTKYYPITLLTNRKGHADQAGDEYEMFLALYGTIQIKLKKKKSSKVISLNAYHDMAISLKVYQNEIMRRMIKEQIMLDHPEMSNPREHQMTRTNNRRRIEKIRELCREAKRRGFKILLIIDEIHWGSGLSKIVAEQERGGIMDQMMSEIHDNLKDEDDEHMFIGLSATPYSLLFLDRVDVVYHRLADDFCGANFWNGRAIDPTAKTVLPRLASFAEQQNRWNIPHLDGIDPTRFKDEDSYTKWCTKYDCKVSWETYRTRCIKSMAAAINVALSDGAVCMRFINNNATMGEVDDNGRAKSKDSVLGRLQKLLDDVHIVAYNADKARQKVKTVLNPLIKKNKRILIVVTGAARMSDAFPGSVRTLLDFTSNTITLSALLQGMYGRSMGYGKLIKGVPPLVVMSERNSQNIRNWIAQKGRLTQTAAHDTVQTHGHSGWTTQQLNLDHKLNNPEVDRILAKLQSTIIDKLDGNLSTVTKARNALFKGHTSHHFPFWDIVDERFLKYLETNAGAIWPELTTQLRFLRPMPLISGCESEQYDVPNPYIAGFGAFGIRDATIAGRTGGNDTTSRERRRLATRTQPGGTARGSGHQPQLHVEYSNKRWILPRFVLRLEHEVCMSSFSTEVLPKPDKSMFSRLLTDAEKDRAEGHTKQSLRKRR